MGDINLEAVGVDMGFSPVRTDEIIQRSAAGGASVDPKTLAFPEQMSAALSAISLLHLHTLFPSIPPG